MYNGFTRVSLNCCSVTFPFFSQKLNGYNTSPFTINRDLCHGQKLDLQKVAKPSKASMPSYIHLSLYILRIPNDGKKQYVPFGHDHLRASHPAEKCKKSLQGLSSPWVSPTAGSREATGKISNVDQILPCAYLIGQCIQFPLAIVFYKTKLAGFSNRHVRSTLLS